MDPDVTLRRARAAIRRGNHAPTRKEAVECYREAAEHFEVLDEWLSRGGFPPHSWAYPRSGYPHSG